MVMVWLGNRFEMVKGLALLVVQVLLVGWLDTAGSTGFLGHKVFGLWP